MKTLPLEINECIIRVTAQHGNAVNSTNGYFTLTFSHIRSLDAVSLAMTYNRLLGAA